MAQMPDVKRIRISVPEDDEAVLAWFDAQYNVSQSVRAIVKEAIAAHGLRDHFSSSIDGDLVPAATPVREEVPKVQAKAERKVQSAPATDGGVVMTKDTIQDLLDMAS